MNAPHFLARPAFLILLGAALLMVPSLLNGFPFIFPDSIDYLGTIPLIYRLPFYGAFITFFHWDQFIWGPVIMQCMVVSHLLWLLMKLTSGTPTARIFLPFMALMATLTSLPFFTGFICADIFTPILFLTFYILAFHHRQLSGSLRYYLFLLACISTVMHISNLTLGMLLCFILMALLTLARAPWRESKHSLTLIATPILLGIISVLLFNGLVFKTWSLSPAGQSFFLANMIEYGPARDYLDEACPTIHYPICKYRPYPQTANELMWNEASVYWKLGGFIGMQEQAKHIVHETIRTHPLDVATMIGDNFIAGLKSRTPAEEFYAKYQIKPFMELLRNKFGADTLQQFNDSAEMRDTIPHKTLEAIDRVVPPLSFALVILIILATIKSRPPAFNLCVATLGFVLGNTLLCTALSGVFDRYQARVAWLLPMAVSIVLMDYLKKRRA